MREQATGDSANGPLAATANRPNDAGVDHKRGLSATAAVHTPTRDASMHVLVTPDTLLWGAGTSVQRFCGR